MSIVAAHSILAKSRSIRSLVLPIALLLWCYLRSIDASANEQPSRDALQRLAEETLLPQPTGHESQSLYLLQFERAKALLSEAEQLVGISALCVTDRDELIQQWHTVVSHYMALQGQQKGPPLALEQSWNMLFWPDKKNTLGRQIQRLIRDYPAISVEELRAKSVTVQGLGAYEWLLFDSATSKLDASVRCHWQAVVAQSIAISSKIIAKSWTENPWAALNKEQWQQERFSLVNNQLDFMLKKLALPLGKVGKPKPFFAEAWRSQSSYRNLYHNLRAIKDTLMVEGGLLASLQVEEPKLARLIRESLAEAIEAWPLQVSLFSTLSTDDGYRNALNAYNRLDYLNYLISEQAAQTLGVRVGFNSSDGD
ncbi:imelysin family protein [Vibrio sp. WXL103]|uniref:imelysin family protein n=1 Tax=Vibrio sp. WXL103 TaxID=3450710 RepID=UPI003EC66627